MHRKIALTIILILLLTGIVFAEGAKVNTVTSTSISTNQVSVDDTAGGTLVKAANYSRASLMVRNIGATDAYCGASGVTTSTGQLVRADEALVIDRSTAAVYCITAAGSTTFAYLED